MNCQPIELKKQSSLIKDYRNRSESIFTHFHYDPYQLRSFKKRYEYLMHQTYQRDKLADVLISQNQKWGLTEQVKDHIEQIRNPESVVVIGGQQAGLLTGPLYTIHKIVSIILQAKEQQEHLGKPVIPVFWIAGEDHDFEEINHIFAMKDQRLKKYKVKSESLDKKPVSKRIIDVEEIKSWVNQLFSTFKETEHTKHLYQSIINAIQHGDSYVDFFAKMIHQMFAHEGLVLVDSDHPDIRCLEKDYFIQLVEHQPAIAQSVVNQLKELDSKSYSINLDATTEDGHLFYHMNGERLLLEVEDGRWVSKDEQVSFTHEELVEEIQKKPDQFSNNVVTRPIMQEMVFPVLSFIGGPGEIAYWSTLKPAFETLNLQFPIITPRLTITLLDSKHQQWLKRFGLPFEQVMTEGTNRYKINWLKRQTSSPIEDVVEQVEQDIELIHQPLQDLASEIQVDLGEFAQSNLKLIQSELKKLEKKMMKEVKRKHQHTISQLEELNAYYYPHHSLQERVWNIVYFMNEYGLDLPKKLLEVPPRWEQDHLVVEL
ncbi:bacillithiol biosynthesis cysteine-adding enzyme BshC [Piscibacillus halophilus]|uniref:Putative cysteine ligase BshC n=1 Tax=Piscibacillus halophilus TaxID=571933 RepID=A0A1H8YSU0_9BACI|nr:bacillithiol biosynthesis cysteine-adding enzyme BshC [Piscibacillus halophilus]SEP55132.1 bacillithiol biosynthesis cysteine-adding enzyme BshC [Piscibacillus halophilus]